MREASKAVLRYLHDSEYATRFFVGAGIDIGAGNDSLGVYQELFPLMTNCRAWDKPEGDAQELPGCIPQQYDWVFSSHCLEHMVDPYRALHRWWEVLKPDGHLIVIVPDEDMYEQGVWPSTWNPDHKSTFTTYKRKGESWSPVSINVTHLIATLPHDVKLLRLQAITRSHRYWPDTRMDQTTGIGESAIEFILYKKVIP